MSTYKGIQYTVVATAEPDVWEWRYQIGDKIKSGRTQTRLAALAARRVQSKIDAALRAARPLSTHADPARPESGASKHMLRRNIG
ncbi:MAG: hypothetical protein JOY90_12370 [Bradyrhizobium sp.]|uniref:hypothetical protein n=1 Tax=Bradyrhizobium sp. TaxID=376 RepID=UPI001DD80FE1|nr:hypothetical protein [Bradyrhizobium sp.]MBV9561231.1 hypothetical protein [Bradyrhizobium sp.]